MVNNGNVCFCNSVLQALYSIPALRDYMLSRRWEHDINPESRLGSKGVAMRALGAFFASYAAGDPDASAVLRVAESRFEAGQQHDAHEFMTHVIDQCHEDCNRDGSSFFSHLFHGRLQTELRCRTCGATSVTSAVTGGLQLDVPCWEQLLSNTSAFSVLTHVVVPVRAVVNGRAAGVEVFICLPRVAEAQQLRVAVARELRVAPEHIRRVFLSHNGSTREIYPGEFVRVAGYTVEIEGSAADLKFLSKTVTLGDALNAYFKDEPLDEWRCEGCRALGGTKRVRVLAPPRYLVLSIKLFEMGFWGCVKKKEYIGFPDEFELTPFMQQGTAKYRVCAAVYHIGYSFLGHYFACVRTPNGWYNCNDLSVSGIQQDQIHRNDVYILVYELCV